MNINECVVGATVICVRVGDTCYGQIGIISAVNWHKLSNGCIGIDTYTVHNVCGIIIGGCSWCLLESWDLYDSNMSRLAKTITAQKVLSKECPCGINRKDCEYHK